MRRLALTVVLALALARPAGAYIEAAHSFGQVVAQSSNIVLMQVAAVDREKNLIVYRKLRDLKGVHAADVIKHNIGRAGLRPNEWKPPMDWAEPGKVAVFFYQGGASETCIGNWWYQAYAGGEWWNHSHGEPFLLRTYAGPPDKLAAIVTGMLEGREMIAPCMADGDKEALHNRTARILRLRVSLKLQNYDPKRDFAGWGGDDFRRLRGMPGFTHLAALPRTDPDAQAISAADFDGDGKTDLCLVGGGRLVILQNNGESLGEVTLPGIAGARAAVWGDYNGDGLPDLFLATPSGPRLFTNLGGQLRDDSHVLPPEPYHNLAAAAWTDADGDGRPDLLVANGYHGLRLYRNTGLPIPPMPTQPKLGPWSFLGPVDNTGWRGFRESHPAEEKLDLKGTYDGKGDLKITWQQRDFPDGTPNDLLPLFPPKLHAWVAVYLHRTIDAPEPFELPLSFGSDDMLTVWLDGKKILAEGAQRGVAPDQNRATVKLAAGKHDLLLKICQGEGAFGFYFNAAKLDRPPPRGLAFEDVSARVGLGPGGAAADVKLDALAVQDVDGDGRPDFLYGNRLFLNRPDPAGGFAYREVPDAGLGFRPHRAGPVFGDFDGDGRPDLLVPQRDGPRLFRNETSGRFRDVTSEAGALNGGAGWVTSAAWGDLDNDGRLDLVLGCLKAPNRFLRNRGDGTFEDLSDRLGLGQRIFNSQAVACFDLNADGHADLVFNNEGQESVILLGSGALSSGKRMPLSLRVEGKGGLTGSTVRVLGKDGKLVAAQELSGGDGRGSQPAPLVRLALERGSYQVELCLSSGTVRRHDFEVGDSPVRGLLLAEGPAAP